MNSIAKFLKEQRKMNKITQEEFALRSGLGLRFIRDLEQGKTDFLILFNLQTTEQEIGIVGFHISV